MSFFLLHGDHLSQSRLYMQSLIDSYKKRGIKDITRLKYSPQILSETIQSIESISLFQTPRLTIIEDLFHFPSLTIKKDVINYLITLKSNNSYHLIIWDSKKLSLSQTKKFNHFTIKSFTISPVIFKFLNSISPHHQTSFLPLFYQTINKDGAEFIFIMLIRHFRQLIQVGSSNCPLPPWQLSQLKHQSQLFSPELLLNTYDQLLSIDWRVKTGHSPLGLLTELELLLAKI